jgi:hypothetical protein
MNFKDLEVYLEYKREFYSGSSFWISKAAALLNKTVPLGYLLTKIGSTF